MPVATHLKSVQPIRDPLDDMSLPGWLYFDPEFFEAEKKAFLRAAPQVVCHESEIPEAGEWRTLEYLGESVIVIRGDDGRVRAFSNVCRHRGSRLVDGTGMLEGPDVPVSRVELCAGRAPGRSPAPAGISGSPDRDSGTEAGRARKLAGFPVRHARTWCTVDRRDDGAL